MNRTSAQVVNFFEKCPKTPSELFEKISKFRDANALHFYMRIYGLEQTVAEDHFQEMLKFLCIARFDKDVTPSEQLDEMWHAMIIQTKGYEVLCSELGEFIHHSTTDRPQKSCYRNAIDHYKREFGQVHPIWTTPKMHQCPQKEMLRAVAKNVMS